MKTRITMKQLYEDAASHFKRFKETTPTHCDVRCVINDLLDFHDKSGFSVNFNYSQDKAHLAVLKLLKK